MRDERRLGILTSLLFIGLGAFLYGQSLSIRTIVENDVGSGYMPRLVGGSIVALAVLKLILSLKPRAVSTEKAAAAGDDNDNKGGCLTIAALVLYVLLFEVLGFLVSTALYLFAQILILSDRRNRNLPLFAVVSVAVSVIVYALFAKAFDLILPQGILYF